MTEGRVREELVELERRFWFAGGDPGVYRDHFADGGRCVFSFGALDKEATMAAIEGATPWEAVEFEDVTTVDLGPDTVALVYGADARDAGGNRYRAAVSSVYVRRDGAWELALHQQSEAPAT
jgi:hypothetical protein